MDQKEELRARFLTKNESQVGRFQRAIVDLAAGGTGFSSDESVAQDVRNWLDSDSRDEGPLDWKNSRGITADEWFFITTLYGNMTENEQHRMIRKFFGSLFVDQARRDIRNFQLDLQGYEGLRHPWMKSRLCKMADILKRRDYSMQDYVNELRCLNRKATFKNPVAALRLIAEDHRATEFKTLSVFVRDCVLGNCFPIDQRVDYQLIKYDLPRNEKFIVQMSLALDRNPRELARLFYEAAPGPTGEVDG